MKKLKSVIFILFLLVTIPFLTGCFEQNYIDKPEVGDVYLIECLNITETIPVAYKFIKVKEIVGDSISVMPNIAYYHEKVYCLTALDFFNTQDAYFLSHEQIKKMYAEGEILEVTRIYEKSCLGNDK